jgi:hypothetical protein
MTMATLGDDILDEDAGAAAEGAEGVSIVSFVPFVGAGFDLD